MKNRILKVWFLILVFLLSSSLAFTQISDTTTLWTIITKDGNDYIGIILDESSTVIQLKTESIGVINIPIEIIVNREKLIKKIWLKGSCGSRIHSLLDIFGDQMGMDSRKTRVIFKTYGF